ncbi:MULTISPECIES: ABC transporter permease [Rhizobium/Agrobacterium group]|uniref:ABC transporter membrane spanning protein (Aliphatic sulphonate) n=2 Tax=Rhizobium/Agrobacterium group TaxID=227290 RepID=B9K4U9_ALLAM|nr:MULTISPECIES: ABC transporter permease [Rhizobium/Agrobacterium group]ACM39897.1 ABC transporter membrane spanning protein (aliphatic sulphonate) [Allorhizobium ampelinum S4]MCF1448013.1 ABC transporter permease [Allorhizobium ampelinum]MCF1484021.1 ABC transporter permease [Allorhizobium ampelinum]MCF1495229.1 ABC transporter permease [Allorhizobium ampelinum]MUO28612.1 ABC transporter permease subunit [Agrobacterium vitis]
MASVAELLVPHAGTRQIKIPKSVTSLLLALVLPFALLLLWWLTSVQGWLPEQILPAPRYVYETASNLIGDGELLYHTGVSLRRVVIGFTIGASLGLSLGVLMGLSPRAEDYIKPLFLALAQIPTLGWIPLLMLLVGIEETLKIIIIAKGAFVPVTLNTFSGIRNVSVKYREIGRSFRFSPWQQLRLIVLPAAAPTIFTGIRYGLTNAWTSLVGVELLASSEGLGYLLVWGRQMFWLDTVIVAMVVIGLVGFIMDRGLRRTENLLQRWKQEEA